MKRGNYLTSIIIFLLSVFIAFFLLGNDFTVFMAWWLCLLVLGLIFLPITANLFQSFNDKGYLFSKVIGISLSSYLMWLLSSIKILKFSSFSCILIIIIWILINSFIFLRTKEKIKISLISKEFISMELIFFIILIIAVFIRGFKPDAHGTEKFMDYGFMTSIMRADFMPAEDFWFAGESLNYYYIGQFIATFLTKLSFVPVTHAYNLMLMTLATFSFVLPMSLVYNISKNYFEKNNIKVKYAPQIAGVISGAAVSMAGNLHFTIFYYIVPTLQEILGLEINKYWFSNSTRYIGYHPETADKTIHEYPSYSFILGDLHAHVLNIIFVLTIIAILYSWLCDSKKIDISIFRGKNKLSAIKAFFNPQILFIGFFIGLFHMTNFWDFPIYLVVTGGVVVFCLIRNYGFTKITFLLSFINGIIIILISELVALPFTLSFDQISTNILRTSSHTPLYQFLILWGLPIVIAIGFISETLITYKIIKTERKSNNIFFIDNIVSYFRSLSLSDMFVLILVLCAMGLLIIPELIYVEDIYSGDYKRANTMFKLTYQSFIMFGISIGYIFIKFFKARNFLWQRKFAIVCFILFITTLTYFPVAVKGWYGDVSKFHNYKGLDASAFLEDTMPEDYKAINWINENIERKSVILEANSDSYSDYQRISVFTGHTTVLGWYTHEWLWRGDTDVLNERAADISDIYTSNDIKKVDELINKYKIEYIYVGELEYDKYGSIDELFLESLGEKVYESSSSSVLDRKTYIIKLN